MSRKRAFWATLAILGLTGAILAFRLFPVAFPLLSVDIEMDRQEALTEALALSGRFEWEPEQPRQAASFSQISPTFQTYMELEGDGLESLNRMVEAGSLQLYSWRVRHFQHEVVEEAEIRFTPRGEPFGFDLHLSEETPGTNVSASEARQIALATASESWGVDPALYQLAESSQEERPGGRIDHTFVYRMSGLELGEAELRLRLRVAGDRLVELTRFYHVPDAFLQRFQDTRNANDGIALAGTVLFFLLFVLLAGGGGAVYLLRNRLLEWKVPLVWGAIVAGLMALGSLNGLPLAWMDYDTAIPPGIFVANLVALSVGIFGAGTAFLAFLFMVGEGLLREGCPNHIRQWKFWSPGVANSDAALGRTVAPYLILGMELGYVVVFYLAMTRFAGWWSPASSLVEPDLLATRLPWLTALGTSLFAAFSEETMFRAIPIGAAALMGRRFGKAGLWIWGTIVLQALIFAASHANYPQQPSYARVVEIFPTYLAWGAVVLYFGLVPSILGHFLYDLVFFSLPLFAADTGGVWVDRSVILAAGILPLAVVLIARTRIGRVKSVPEWALNRNWRPSPDAETGRGQAPTGDGAPVPTGDGALASPGGDHSTLEEPGPSHPEPGLWAAGRLSPVLRWGFGVAGLVGIGLWAATMEPEDPPRLPTDRSGAEEIARESLAERGTILDPEWTPLFSVATGRGSGHEFVWEKGGQEVYSSLLGDFLAEPSWRVRFVRFDADPEERAEDFLVRIGPEGSRVAVSHVLPEGRAGASLGEEEARVLSLRALQERLGTRPEGVREVSAEKSALPARTDWTFTYAALEGFPLDEGEGRLEVRIGGDEVTGAGRYVDPPEEWEREYRKDASRRMLFSLPAGALLLLLGAVGVVLGIIRWARGEMDTRFLWPVTGTLVVLQLITTMNAWPAQLGGFTTRTGFGNQLALALFGTGVGLALVSVGTGLLAALGHTWIGPRADARARETGWAGVALGLLAHGGSKLLGTLGRSGPPGWPSYSDAVSFIPWISSGLGPLTGFLTLLAGGLFLFGAMDKLRRQGRNWVAWALAAGVGIALGPSALDVGLAVWMGVGLAIGGALVITAVLVQRLGWRLLPGAVGAVLVLESVESGLMDAFPGAAAGSVLAILLLVSATVAVVRAFSSPRAAT